MSKSKLFVEFKKILDGEDSKERTLLANALLIEKIKRKPISFDKCVAILNLLHIEDSEVIKKN